VERPYRVSPSRLSEFFLAPSSPSWSMYQPTQRQLFFQGGIAGGGYTPPWLSIIFFILSLSVRSKESVTRVVIMMVVNHRRPGIRQATSAYPMQQLAKNPPNPMILLNQPKPTLRVSQMTSRSRIEARAPRGRLRRQGAPCVELAPPSWLGVYPITLRSRCFGG
jgi:hypothetical protein